MNDKNIFVHYDDLIKAKRLGDKKISVIIDLTNYKNIFIIKEELDKIKEKLINKSINIDKIFITSFYYKELLEFIINNKIFTFVSFLDEDNFRVEISQLDDSYKEHIVGLHPVNSGVGVVLYKVIGIKNIILESPILNNEINIKMLNELGYNNLFAFPNVVKYKGDIDSNWIRPEAITLYKKLIPNYVLFFDEDSNVDAIINAYYNEQWLGKLGDIIINSKDTTIENVNNILPYSFDKRRMSCEANCHSCIKCNRDLDYVNRMKNLLIKEDY